MLELRNLRIKSGHKVLSDIPTLTVAPGERLGIVGESGSGKTLTVMSIISLLPEGISATGEVLFHGDNLLGMTERRLQDIRGKRVGVVFQDPSRALNPTMKIGRQLAEVLRLHGESTSRDDIRNKMLKLLKQVSLDAPAVINSYPHELSGGQQQRVVIAIAMACGPDLLIADEPTTALDVTVQKSILELLLCLCSENNMGLIFVSHNLGVVQSICDRIAVMYQGALVEVGPAKVILGSPQEQYTRDLIAASPSIPQAKEG
jgi:peptide/nickel transport system ATP-binding protein